MARKKVRLLTTKEVTHSSLRVELPPIEKRNPVALNPLMAKAAAHKSRRKSARQVEKINLKKEWPLQSISASKSDSVRVNFSVNVLPSPFCPRPLISGRFFPGSFFCSNRTQPARTFESSAEFSLWASERPRMARQGSVDLSNGTSGVFTSDACYSPMAGLL